MNWAYIAGFFDGEGYVGMPLGRNGLRLNIAQSGNRGKVLLIKIQDFLASKNIHSYIHSTLNYSKDHPRHQEKHNLWISQWDSLEIFMLCVLPYIHIKKLSCQDYLRYMALYPKKAQKLRNQSERIKKIREQSETGKSFSEIARQEKLAISTIARVCNRETHRYV